MSEFKQNLIKARSHLIFLTGLLLSFALVIWLEMWEPEETLVHRALHQTKEPFISVGSDGDKIVIRPMIKTTLNRPEALQPRELTALERKWSRVAWQYFDNNYQPETGFVNSTDYYPSTTLWDLSSYLLGMIGAHRLGVVDDEKFYLRTSKLLDSLASIELFDGRLPNKVYHTQTLAMVDYNNQPTERGIGWSALDIARFLVPLHSLSRHYPEFTHATQRVIARWDLESMFRDGQMMGARLATVENAAAVTPDSETAEHTGESRAIVELVQEGRLGYEEYAAKASLLEGWDASRAGQYDDYLKMVPIYGIDVATDARDPKEYDAHNYVVTEPYVLDGVEFGWDAVSAELAWRVHEVQRLRYEATGKLTAVSEDNIDREPHFVYNTIFTGGKAWNTITEDGEDASEFATLSTKAAFGMHMLFESEYTHKLISRLYSLNDPERGWYSGIYEVNGETNSIITANTNGIILETLAFKKFGPLLKYRDEQSLQVAEID